MLCAVRCKIGPLGTLDGLGTFLLGITVLSKGDLARSFEDSSNSQLSLSPERLVLFTCSLRKLREGGALSGGSGGTLLCFHAWGVYSFSTFPGRKDAIFGDLGPLIPVPLIT